MKGIRTRTTKAERKSMNSVLERLNRLAMHFEENDVAMYQGTVESNLNFAISLIEGIIAETSNG